MMFDNDMTVRDARERLYDLILEEGSECPCCHQFAKVYKRKIHATMARELITFSRACSGDWAHLPTIIGHNGGDVTKSRYWGLLEEFPDRRADGGRAGYWRLTAQGRSWVDGNTTVPKYALIYDGDCLSVEGEEVSIHDALGKKFDYRELMAA